MYLKKEKTVKVQEKNIVSKRNWHNYNSGLEIHFFGGSKLLLPSSKLGSKTNFVVAKC